MMLRSDLKEPIPAEVVVGEPGLRRSAGSLLSLLPKESFEPRFSRLGSTGAERVEVLRLLALL